MNIKVYTPIELEMQSYIMPYLFQSIVAPTIQGDTSKLLSFSMMIPQWEAGLRLNSGDYVRYGVDGNGYPMIYQVLQAHTSQVNNAPGSDHSANLYEIKGYYEYYRVWSYPAGAMSTYSLDDIVPHLAQQTHEAITYVAGITVYKDNYIISPDNQVYQVVPNQITMNTDYVPFTDTNVYTPVEGATVVSPTEISIEGYVWFKSNDPDNDNRTEPSLTNPTWDVVDNPNNG